MKTTNLILTEVAKPNLNERGEERLKKLFFTYEQWLEKIISHNQFVTVECWNLNFQGELEILSMYPVHIDEMIALGKNITEEFYELIELTEGDES